MKAKKFLYSLLLMLFASFFIFQPVLAISQQQLENFANNNIYFYDPGDQTTSNCYSSSAGLVTETDAESMIWNWFVNANIPGVSNNAEVIAGIIGNFKQEVSSFNPFAWGGPGHGYGIYKATGNADFVKEIESIFGSDIWDTPLDQLSPDTIRRGIEAELKFMVSSTYNWNHSNFLNLLDIPTNKTGEDGAAAYAELFMLVFERPGNYTSIEATPADYRISAFYIQDPGVASYELTYYNRTKNNLYLFGNEKGNPRRSYYARQVYKKYANNDIPIHAQTTVTGADLTIIGDDSITNYKSNLEQALETVEIKTVSSLTEAISTINETNRANIVVSLNTAKEQFLEDDFSILATTAQNKTLYLVQNSSLEQNDNFKNNATLFRSISTSNSNIEIITTDSVSQLAQTLSKKFAKPIVNSCSTSETTIPDSIFPNDFVGTDISKMPNDTTDIACPSGEGTIVTYYGNKKLRLCTIPGFNIKTSSVAAYAFTQFYQDHNNYIKQHFGIDLSASESFRTKAKQKGFWDAYCPDDPYNMSSPAPIHSCSNPNKNANLAAYPGYSKHEYGLAVDINVPKYNNNTNKWVSQYSCKSTYDAESKNPYDGFESYNMADTPSGSSNLKRWQTEFTQYMCENLYQYGLRYTVKGEVWHIQYVGKGGHASNKI